MTFCRNLGCLHTDILPFQQKISMIEVSHKYYDLQSEGFLHLSQEGFMYFISLSKQSVADAYFDVLCWSVLIHKLDWFVSSFKAKFCLPELIFCWSTSLCFWTGLSKGPTSFCCSIQVMWAIPSHPDSGTLRNTIWKKAAALAKVSHKYIVRYAAFLKRVLLRFKCSFLDSSCCLIQILNCMFTQHKFCLETKLWTWQHGDILLSPASDL